MHKKLMLACMAIAAFAAFVIAPAASATNLKENGTTVGVGASIKGTNTAGTVTKFTAEGLNVECTHAELKGKVTRDDSGIIEGTIPKGAYGVNYTFSSPPSEDCTSALGPVRPTLNSEICLKIANSDAGTATGCGGNISFTLDVTNFGISCTYSTASVANSITTGTGEVTVSEQKAGLTEGGFLCPPEGKLDLNFVLTTTDGTPLVFTT